MLYCLKQRKHFLPYSGMRRETKNLNKFFFSSSLSKKCKKLVCLSVMRKLTKKNLPLFKCLQDVFLGQIELGLHTKYRNFLNLMLQWLIDEVRS